MLQRTLLGTMVASIMAGLAAPMPALAQESLEEVVVTARKRAESLREIPIAISAVTADRIERENITRLEELTMRVPGVQYHSLGLAIPGRVNSSIRFRGMDVNSQVPTFQLGTLFVDGIYVLGGTHSIPFDDVERVEVIKGPQSAYFGRNTFGGAINYITKEPRLDEFEGDVKVLGAEFDEYEISGAVSGPLLKDKLGIRVGGRKYRRGGMFTASDGGELGEESTDSYQIALKFQPIDNLTIIARYWHGQDEDGPAAGGAIPGRLNNTCTGQVTNPAGQTVTPARWFCGTVPEQGDAISPLGTRQVIDSNTLTTSARALASTGDANWLLTNFIQRPYPARIDGKVPTLEAIEMERETTRVSAKVTYEFDNGMTADLVWGDNKMAASWVRDYNFTGFDNGYSRDPQYDKDRSAEVRLTSAQDQKLRWLVGLNYYEQSFITAGGGGDAVFFCIDSVAGPTIGACRPGPAPSAFAFFPNSLNNSDHVETKAIFAAAAYDFTDWFTLSLEGRYQDDSFERGLTTITKIEDENFLPRVILQFKPREGTNLYASYAEGLIQGEINQLVVDADARERAQFDAVGTPGNVPAEILKSYEIGWKQLFLDSRLSVNTAAYYGTWSDKKIRQVVAVNFTCGDTPTTMGSVGCRPNLGEGSLGEPARNPDGSPALNNVNVVSAYDVDIWGVELEFDSVPTDRLRVGGALTWARSEVQEGIYNTIALIAGSNNIKGAANPRFPEWSGSINAEYAAPLSNSWEWFVRGDANYFGKAYVDLDNLAQCDDYTIANAGLGVSKENVRIEVFARNLLDDDSWAACARFLEFDLPLDQAGNAGYHTVIVAPQNPRQFGLRASYRF